MTHYHLSRREDKTTETDDIAIAAEPIHGCSTRPMGRNTPVDRRDSHQSCTEDQCDDQSQHVDEISLRRPPTGCNRDADQVVDESEDEVDPDPFHGLFREVDTAHHVQEVVLQQGGGGKKKRLRTTVLNSDDFERRDVETGGKEKQAPPPLTLIKTTSAASMATSVPVPMAMPTSAMARAGESFTPSPTMATLFPACCSCSTLATLWDGSTSANTFRIPTCGHHRPINSLETHTVQ